MSAERCLCSRVSKSTFQPRFRHRVKTARRTGAPSKLAWCQTVAEVVSQCAVASLVDPDRLADTDE
jgi:hypothetical protein